MIQIKPILAEETYAIRLEVLRKNISLPHKFKGDFDKETFHLGAYLNGELVGIATFMKNENSLFNGNQYQLRGMATLEKVRGLGAGKKIMVDAFTILKNKNVNYLWCNARVEAVPFYKKLGLQTLGNEFLIKQVGPHFIMYKKLQFKNN